MRKLSSKKWFFYISTIILLCYFMLVLIAYNAKDVEVLYNEKTCNTYYLFSYLILSAVLYCIDVYTKKEPAFLTLFCLPIYTCAYLMMSVLCSCSNEIIYLFIFVGILIVYILHYFANKFLISKIIKNKNIYNNLIFFYIVAHLMIALYISFVIFGYM